MLQNTQAIRKEISNYLLVLPTIKQPREHELIKRIFSSVKKVREVSP